MISRFEIIDRLRKTSILDKYAEIEKFQKADKSLIIEEQKRRLSRLLIYLRGKNNFYSKLLAKFPEAEIINEPAEVLHCLPFTDKTFLNNHYDDVFKKDDKQNLQVKRTGGSTGTPFKYFINSESISYSWAYIYLFWKRYADYNPGDPYITIAGTSLHSQTKKIFEFFYYLLQNNYALKGDIISPNMSFNYKKLRKAKLVYGYPSTINLLLEYYPDLFKDSKNLKAIFTTSELLIPQVRRSIEEKTNKKVFDMYGANDGGIASSECHLHNGYHYNMLNCFAESIEKNGQQELVVTSLHNYNFPFVRYKVGDIGSIDNSACECGNPFDKITGLKGRTRDLIYLKNKKVFHGSLINSMLFKYPEVKLYKVVQEKDYSVNLKILVEPEEIFSAVAEKLLREVSTLFGGLSFQITKLSEKDSTEKKFKLIESHVS